MGTANLDEEYSQIILYLIFLKCAPEEGSGQISLSGNDWEVLSERDAPHFNRRKEERPNEVIYVQLNMVYL